MSIHRNQGLSYWRNTQTFWTKNKPGVLIEDICPFHDNAVVAAASNIFLTKSQTNNGPFARERTAEFYGLLLNQIILPGQVIFLQSNNTWRCGAAKRDSTIFYEILSTFTFLTRLICSGFDPRCMVLQTWRDKWEKGKVRTVIKAAVCATLLWLCLAAPTAFAGALEDGAAAYKQKDYATALRLWLPFARRGNAQVQHNVGYIYAKGLGIRQDYGQAVNWYRKAAEQGYADAQNNLGVMYDKGLGVPQDYAHSM
ncbi:MAG: tetratricopeptide repeat protein [Acidimicrobiales bacterium]